jgi:hypothetical protein
MVRISDMAFLSLFAETKTNLAPTGCLTAAPHHDDRCNPR